MPSVTRRDHLRRALILCCSFGRNLAYYRAGIEPEFSVLCDPSHPHASFWRQANSSFLDIAVLEWCKLIADGQDNHCWKKIVGDQKTFENGLLDRLRMTSDEFKTYVGRFRRYRDKFIAHLDSDKLMNIPEFDQAKEAVWFYHEHIVTEEVSADDLNGLAAILLGHMELGYEQCQIEAREIFRHAVECQTSSR